MKKRAGIYDKAQYIVFYRTFECLTTNILSLILNLKILPLGLKRLMLRRKLAGSGAGGKAPLYLLTAHNNAGAAAGRRRAETELFFWLGQPYWRRGYGSEVALALTDAAFRATEIEALYARADPANIAAARILGKCGFALLGAGAEAAAERPLLKTER